jgi:hypothetical protein
LTKRKLADAGFSKCIMNEIKETGGAKIGMANPNETDALNPH